jgi:hypothetical protein
MAGTGITRRKSTWLAEPLSEGNFFYRVAFRNGFANLFHYGTYTILEGSDS